MLTAETAIPPVHRVDRGAMAVRGACLFLAMLVAAALVGPLVLGQGQEVALTDRLEPPVLFGGSWSHPLGTDELGRDVLTRFVGGARVSLLVGFGTVLLAGVFGTTMGLLTGYYRRFDSVIMRIVDAALAFPGLLIVLVVLAFLGPSEIAIIVVLALVNWMLFTKMTRDSVVSLRSTPFVEAAETVGCSPGRVMRRYLLPHVAPGLLTVAILEFANAVLAEAALSYVGFGIQPPAESWGLMVAAGQPYAREAWWLVVLPGLGLAATVLALHVVANWRQTTSDPRASEVHSGRTPQEASPAQTPPGLPLDSESQEQALLSVRDLQVSFRTSAARLEVVRGVSFDVRAGETLAMVGESGSGKSVTAMSILDLLPATASVDHGSISWCGEVAGGDRRRQLRGRHIGMVFQDPTAALDPLMPVGRQIAECLRRHRGMSRREAASHAIDLLRVTGIALPELRAKQYPHELSGGMCQRVVIASAIAAEPDLLIADEPTSSLDVTIQSQILELLAKLQADLGIAVLLISHDFGVVAKFSSRVIVMYAGRLMEQGSVRDVLNHPRHPYTVALLRSSPRLDRDPEGLTALPGRSATNLDDIVGCPFHPRCERASAQCRSEMPPMVTCGSRRLACWHPHD